MAKSLKEYKQDQALAESRVKANKELLEQVKIDLQQYDVGSPMYNKAKERAKNLNAEIKKYETQLKKVKAEVDKLVSEEKASKDKAAAKDAAKNAPALREKANRAEDAGDTAAAEKYRAAADKLEADAKKDYTNKPTSESKTGTQFKLTDEQNVANLLSSATVSMGPSGPIVQITEPNKKDPVTGEATVYQGYLYLTTTEGGTGEKAIFFGTKDVIRDRYQKQLIKNYGSKQAVIDKLYKAGYLPSNKEISTSTYLSALDSAAAEYTVAQVNAYQQEGVKEFPTMDEFLAARKGDAGLAGTKTRTETTVYSDTDVTKIINQMYQNIMGRDANTKELGKLIPIVQKQLSKNPDLIYTTTDAEGNVVATKRKTGLNPEQFLIDEVSQKDEAKANKVLGYYNIFKQSIGVN